LDETRIRLRDKGEQYDQIEDTTAALERCLQSLLSELKYCHLGLHASRSELNQYLADISGSESVTMTSNLGQRIINAAEKGVEAELGQEDPEWVRRLNPQTCRQITEEVSQVRHEMESLQGFKKGIGIIMESLKLQQSSSRRITEAIEQLRSKRASLEVATACTTRPVEEENLVPS